MNDQSEAAVHVSASLRVSKKHSASIAPFAIKTGIVLLSCMGSVLSFLSCFDMPAGKAAVIIISIISCAVFMLSFNMKKGARGIVSASVSALFVLITFILRSSICAGLANALNIYLARIRKEFRGEPFILIAEPELSARHTTIFFCFAAALICLAAAYCVSKEWYAIGLCIPPLILPILTLMFGLEPDYIAFSAVIAGCAAAISFEIGSAEKICSVRYKYAASFGGLSAALFAVLFFFLSAAAVKISGYSRSERIDGIYNDITGYIERGEMKNVFEEVVTFVTRDTKRTGAIDHGKLGEMDEIYFDGKTVLRVTMPKPEDTFYLRGFIGSVYTGNSWKPLSSSELEELENISAGFETDGLSTMLFDSYSLKNTGASMPRYSFAIQNVSAGRDYLYMPYSLVPESVSRYNLETGGGFAGGENSYVGQFYDPSDYYGYQGIFRTRWNISPSMANDEAAYRNFVYENYLDLPEEHERLDEIFGDNYYEYITGEDIITGKSTLGEMTVFSRKLYYIRSWLRNNCEYSLSAGKLPAGRDFVDRFLETRKGSCSHFATTAVMMCRYAGIPARYVEGYIIKPNTDFPGSAQKGDIETIEITDARAHAWAEIYIDGFGWYPMEFTSGYGNVRTALPTETLAAETESSAETTSVSEETEISSSAAESAAPSPGGSEQNASSEQENAAEQSQPSEDSSAAEVLPEEPDITDDEAVDNGRPSVGFGVFGIRGGKKVDVYYDLTGILIAVIIIIAVPALFIIRRRICLLIYSKKCSSGKKQAADAAYRKFRRIIHLMKLPEQGEMGYLEYAKTLSERSALLSDGIADTVIGTALKASFGGRQLTAEEAHEAVITVTSLSKRFYSSLSKWEKFKAKYIYCIV